MTLVKLSKMYKGTSNHLMHGGNVDNIKEHCITLVGCVKKPENFGYIYIYALIQAILKTNVQLKPFFGRLWGGGETDR